MKNFEYLETGKYLTLDGREALVTHLDADTHHLWCWHGELDGKEEQWRKDGRMSYDKPTLQPNDLVTYLGPLSHGRHAGMTQSKSKSALESATNTVVGIVINQAVLWAFGVPFGSATAITVLMIGLSFGRSYIIRRMFA
jgi:hypothetical protein